MSGRKYASPTCTIYEPSNLIFPWHCGHSGPRFEIAGFPLSQSHDGGDSSLSGDSAMQENQLGSQENVV